MSSYNNVIVGFDPLRGLEFDDLTQDYQELGPLLDNPVRMLIISNFTDEDIFISFNGVDDHLKLYPKTERIFDFGSNHSMPSGLFEVPGFRFIWVRHGDDNPTEGEVTASVMFAAPN